MRNNHNYNISNEILTILLKDHSTNKNIIWATDNYINYRNGYGYGENDQIQINLLTDTNGNTIIKPRIEKSKEEQQLRIKTKAEVFTPSWVCNCQNNLIDNSWFEREKVFNEEIKNSWISTKEKITFPKGKTWQDYVNLNCLEITCGEAPYLVSRYDTTTGELIEITNRIGLLDRKLRVINENCNYEPDWVEWTMRAYKSIYGFEWQGDNLFIARTNLLYTFIDYYVSKFEIYPINEYLEEVAKIISWNVFQMDGLKFVVPNSCKKAIPQQISMFEEDNVEVECPGCKRNNRNLHTGVYSRTMNWETKRAIKFINLLKGVK